jgi:hypothetical protein
MAEYWKSQMSGRRRLRLLLVTGGLGVGSLAVPGCIGDIVQKFNPSAVYWADTNGNISRSFIGSLGNQLLVQGAQGADLRVMGLALDHPAGKMYWTVNAASPDGTIRRANLDGTKRETLVENLDGPLGLALDLAGRQMYWTEMGTAKGRSGGTIKRANLDGTNVTTLVTDAIHPSAIALNVLGNTMYVTSTVWGGQGPAGSLWQFPLTGGPNGDLLAITGDGEGTFGLALDINASKIYYASSFGENVRWIASADLDSHNISNLKTLVAGGAPIQLALDLLNKRMYWTDITGTIKRANLDGTNEIVVDQTGGNPTAIALDIVP